MKKYLISIIMVAFSFALLSCGDLNPVKKDGGSPPATPPVTPPTLEDTLWVQILPLDATADTPQEAFLTGAMSLALAFSHQGKGCQPGGTAITKALDFAPGPGIPIPPANYNLTFLNQCGVTDTPANKVPYTLNSHGRSTLGGATGTIGTDLTFTISADGLTMDILNAGTHYILTKAVPSPPLS